MLFGKKTAGEEAAKHANGATGTASGGSPSASEPAAGPAAMSEGSTGTVVSAEEAKKRALAAKQVAAAFGEFVMLMMRSPTERHHTLTDLEWVIVPGLINRQYALAEAQSKETGMVSPVGGVLWAFVSEEVDKRLSDLATPLRLKPSEWRSGDIPWIVSAHGDNRVLAGLIQQLTTTLFKDRKPKMRVRGRDGKLTVGHLEVKEKDAA